MIRRVRLKSWRSYDALDIQVPAGTIFVVAPNGVGKTSLVFGLAWGVFGDESGVDARTCIRAGADRAEVEVELVLPDGRELAITRSIARRGRPKFSGRVADAAFDEAAIRSELENSFGVDLGVAARLSMMLGGGHLASHQALDLESHLHRAFGVDDLLNAAETARSVAKEAEKLRGAVRMTAEQRLADRASVESEITELRTRINRQRETGAQLEDRVRDADRVRRLVERMSAYAEQREAFERKRSDLLDQAQALIAEGTDHSRRIPASAVTEQLTRAREQAEHDANEAAEAYASARGTMKAATEALDLLSGNTPRCPTCLRPLQPRELATARTEHQHKVRTATESAEEHSGAQERYRKRVAAITSILARLESLQPPFPPTDQEDLPTPADAEAVYGAALEAINRHNQDLGALDSRLRQLQAQIASDDHLAEAERELHLAYRREALAAAAADAFESAVTQVMEAVIEPIAAEVRWRWKQLFPNGRLTLRPDGSIARMEAGQELKWETLSGGERIWARIVTHLLVLASSTKLPFAWFDEPLEHLDPQLRHSVASALATATRGGAPTQLLVTTYENTIARQLAEDIPEASLINLRVSGPPDPSTSNDDRLERPDRDAAEQAEQRRAS
jgi:DNA repair exonuclease SbcCD ATPase subunit